MSPRQQVPVRPWIIVLLLVICLALSAWLRREPLVQGAADLWTVSDLLARVDAIVVLGGDYQTRPRVAAELYHRGLVNKVLVSKSAEREQVLSGDLPSYTQLACLRS